MSTLRALLIGLALAVSLIAALFVFGRYNGWIQLFILVPPCVLVGLSLGTPTRGWSRRLIRGLLGAVFAAILALVIIFSFPALFPYPADQGAGLYIALLCLLASIPGFSAAACGKPDIGRALTIGFAIGLSVPLLWHDSGVVLLLFTGTIVGSAVAELGRSSS